MIRQWAPRLIEQELALCERYYEKTFATDAGPVQNFGQVGEAFFNLTADSGAQQVGVWKYRVRKRVSPTLTFYNPVAANAQARNLNAAADCTGTQDPGASDNGAFQLQVTPPGGSTVGNIIAVHATADADL